MLAFLVIRFIFVRRNKRKAEIRSGSGYQKRLNGEFLDLTDFENPGTFYLKIVELRY